MSCRQYPHSQAQVECPVRPCFRAWAAHRCLPLHGAGLIRLRNAK
jgi:hypothetical protein